MHAYMHSGSMHVYMYAYHTNQLMSVYHHDFFLRPRGHLPLSAP